MRAWLGLFIWTDMVNRRVAWEVLAGLGTIALAASISILSISFTESAFKWIEKAIAPTRPVAGIISITARGGLFSKQDYEHLEQKLVQLKTDKQIDDYSPIVASLDGDILPFRDVSGKQDTMLGVTIWCIPYNSPLISQAMGFRFISGTGFNKPTGQDFKARLGVLVNLKYLKKYLHYDDKQLEAARAGELDLPETIRLQFPAISIDDDPFKPLPQPPAPTDLKITGVFDEVSYPDLLLTEDVAKAYFLGQSQDQIKALRGEFSPSYAFHFFQLELDEPLVSPKEAPPGALGFFPDIEKELDYVSIRGAGYEPYDLIQLHVTDWKTEGAREKIRDQLMIRSQLATIDSANSKHLEQILQLSAIGRNTLVDDNAFSAEDVRKARLELGKLIPAASLSSNYTVDPVGDIEAENRRYRIYDRDSLRAFEIDFLAAGHAQLYELPPWQVSIPNAKMTQALVRLRAIINTYGTVMFFVVFALAASASLLLAFSHILRKTRDIGLLFTNGASPSNIFLIYLGEILFVAFFGWLMGIALAYGVRPGIEIYAATTLQQFLASVTEIGIESIHVLTIDIWVILKSFLWVLPAAIIGALFPVYSATKTDPLDSMSKGV